MSDKRLLPELHANLQKISETIGARQEPVTAYIAGGMAVNYHTAARMSLDSDISWSHKVAIPPELRHFIAKDAEGEEIMVSLDLGFSDSIGLFHPDWKQDSIRIGQLGSLIVRVINPVDLAVSKIGRFGDRDREDIEALARAGLIGSREVRSRAVEALDYFIGGTDFLLHNIDDAIALIEHYE